ncbi:hypothetical protein [Corallococcus exercitus]|uniref:DUF2993 domain-containing protein n=1 Tax=Corallococcus exercitus TaxID=2316736 RepID=A0A7Y4JNJ3_9BACT|nr:hypothetical protein [Corallococcus exercitus]NOK08013.1 hypothetical protein [Corallococcus exercitus]
MPPVVPRLRLLGFLLLLSPLTTWAEEDGSEVVLRLARPPPENRQEQDRDWLARGARKLFSQELTYVWPGTEGDIVLALPPQQPRITSTSPQEVHVRIPGGMVARVGDVTSRCPPTGAWSGPSGGGLRVHGCMDPKALAKVLARFLAQTAFVAASGPTLIQSVDLRVLGTRLVLTLSTNGSGAASGVRIQGTPRFELQGDALVFTVPDAEVFDSRGQHFVALEQKLQKPLWKMDPELDQVARKAASFFQTQFGPAPSRVEVKPHQDLRLDVADDRIHFSFSLDTTFIYEAPTP